MAWMAAKWTGEKIHPWDLNPYRKGRPAGKIVQATPEESAIGWAALDRYFAGR